MFFVANHKEVDESRLEPVNNNKNTYKIFKKCSQQAVLSKFRSIDPNFYELGITDKI